MEFFSPEMGSYKLGNGYEEPCHVCDRQLGYQTMVVYWVPTIADGRVTCVHYGHCGQAVACHQLQMIMCLLVFNQE